ncbi:hypothetical protein ACFV6G_00490 [Streptomyces lavendulae]|uniref:hypothetical protein n=1 Tax=Streptomyces lavendulae TaxID=1914 RepID=UPI0036865B1F
MTTVAAEFHADTRQRSGLVPLNTFTFHQENRNHGLFQVSIMDGAGAPFVYYVQAWENMIRTVVQFIDVVAGFGPYQQAKVDVYRTGYTSVNGVNVRVTPLG